jgi:arylsulfatase A-like enzyme
MVFALPSTSFQQVPTMTTFRRIILFSYLLSLCLPLLAVGGTGNPNIVFILADDLGFGDVHAFNTESSIPTPAIDGLAAEGVMFMDAHTPSAVCTPTRYGLITGRYCWRSRLKSGVLNGYSSRLIEDGRATVADLLRSAGYTTGIVGKWHLGLGWSRLEDGQTIDFTRPVEDAPNVLGFDYSCIIPASLDFPPYVYIENGLVTEAETIEQPAQSFPAFLRKGPRALDFIMEDALDHLTAKAVDFIRKKAGSEKPFFLYFPLTAPHKPVLPHERFRGKTDLNDYGDFVVQVDWVVGQVVHALEDAGVRENTMIVFTSDNGSYMYRLDDPTERDHVDQSSIQAFRADRHRSNGPWRGTKADIWEGGHHVPFIVSWPGVARTGHRSDKTICLTDFMATAADITGAEMSEGMGEDSFSFLSLIKGDEAGWTRPPVIHHSASGMFAIRDGRWKLVAGNGSGGRQQPKGKPFAEPFQLFDMAADPGETTDLATDNREIVDRLTRELDAIRE